jgi:hypothetical protein
MKKLISAVVATIVAVILTSAAVAMLVLFSIRISEIENPLIRRVAGSCELLGGIALLLGTLYAATHLAVYIVAKDTDNEPR